MMRIFFTFFFVCVAAISNSIFAQSSQISKKSPAAIDDRKDTKILVLATPHLSQIDDDFSPILLDSLINVLQKYSPDIIGIEALSGAQIAEMERRSGPYESYLESFAEEQMKYGSKVQEALDISWRKADFIADSLLGKVQSKQKISGNTRLELINYLIASYRLHTAALQWSYLSDEYRSNQSVVPQSPASALSSILNSANENASISLRLARQLNLQRIYPIDDHMEKDYYSKIRPQLIEALNDSIVQAVKNAPHIVKNQRLMEKGIEDSSLFPVYQFMNSRAYLDNDKEKQWRNPFLKTSNKVLRTRLALWEVRNLNIAAHIRKASARDPGGRVLITIGGSHKAFLDSYLKEMMGVDVINLNDLAKQ